jgi:hypothetical protein
MRQLPSVGAGNAAPRFSALAASPVAAEIMLIFKVNLPPKPQQPGPKGISISSNLRT